MTLYWDQLWTELGRLVGLGALVAVSLVALRLVEWGIGEREAPWGRRNQNRDLW